VYRCLLGTPFLAVLAAAERVGRPARPRHERVVAWLAGALLAGDLLLWTQAIGEVGAGLSTVLVNVQVVLVPLLAFVVDREPVTARFLLSLPVLLFGVALAGGLVDEVVGYLAPKLLGAGPAALGPAGVATLSNAFDLHVTDVTRIGPDVRITAVPKEDR